MGSSERRARKSYLKKRFGQFCQLFTCSQSNSTIMGDGALDIQQLSDKEYRVRTYTRCNCLKSNLYPSDLATLGFYYTSHDDLIKCHSCEMAVQSSTLENIVDLLHMHKIFRPRCMYHEVEGIEEQLLGIGVAAERVRDPDRGYDVCGSEIVRTRDLVPQDISFHETPAVAGPSVPPADRVCVASKRFHTFDSLRYEGERLNTFIDWPITWLNPSALAKEGLYYLRKKDHVSCVYCRGIIGAWEPGDVPRVEHRRHFPNCRFVNNLPVGNVTLEVGKMLRSLPKIPITSNSNESEAELKEKTRNFDVSKATRSNPIPGIPAYPVSKRPQFKTVESRLESYTGWPSKVKQDPRILAEAGFFYCGLSDHVRCYHCGQGLRNWEEKDDPWEEHARWYSDCEFLRITKGTEFIEKVRRENPPVVTNELPESLSAGTSSFSSRKEMFKIVLTEAQLDMLMELDIPKASIELHANAADVRQAIRNKVEMSGVPYTDLNACLQEAKEVAAQREFERTQSNRINKGNIERTHEPPTSSNNNNNNNTPEVSPNSSIPEVSYPFTLQPNRSGEDIIEFPLVRGNSNTTSNTSGVGSQESLDDIGMDVSPPNNRYITSTPTDFRPTLASSISSTSSGHESLSSTSSEVEDTVREMLNNDDSSEILSQVDVVISQAEQEQLNLRSTKTSQKEEESTSTKASQDVEMQSKDVEESKSQEEAQQTKIIELEKELDRERDKRTCRVCFDAEQVLLFLPCAHMGTCAKCGVSLENCPFCRAEIVHIIRVNIVS